MATTSANIEAAGAGAPPRSRLTVAGLIDASAAKGGDIALYANRGATAGSGQLTLTGTARLKANATQSLAAA